MSDSGNARQLRWLVRLGAVVIRALGATWRVRWVNRETALEFERRGEPFIYVLWHGDLLPLLWAHRNKDISVMISEHRDGELIARVAQLLGFRTVRGSTSRGAARALLSASQDVEAGFSLAITVDGPRGPYHSVAPGALVIAQRSGKAMIPTCIGTTSAWRLRSWDRFTIPKPFARVTIAYGAPIRIDAASPREAADAQQIELVRGAIESATAVAVADTSG